MITKIIKVLSIIVITIIIFFSSVYAADSNYTCNISLDGKKSFEIGKTETYEIKVSNINAEDGIIMFEALIDYDTNIFECNIEQDDKKNWNITGNIENSITMTRKDLLPNSEDQTIGKIVLKAKSNASKGKYTINLKNIRFTMDNDKFFELPDQSKEIEITDTSESDDENESEENKQNSTEENEEQADDNTVEDEDVDEDAEEEPSYIEDDSDKNNQKKETVTIEEKKATLPYAGISAWIILAFVVISVLGSIIFYKKYKNWEKV